MKRDRAHSLPPGRWLRILTPSVLHVPLVEGGTLVLGRGGHADVSVPHASVSRRHAALKVAGAVTLEDLGSANGTTVRGQRLPPGVPVQVRAGEMFELGDVSCALLGEPPTVTERASEPGDLVLEDPAMVALDAQLGRFAAGTISILLLGEMGVGKEVFARRVHARSPRASGPFVPVNCAALPEHLVESELFGYERGAFTGASASRPGLLEAAHGGTVFLDEVGELAPSAQPKLLRALQERSVRPVGARSERPVDVRVVAATNRDLEREVVAGRFREDLYYRLRAVAVRIPALRERPAEVVRLAERFLAEASAAAGRSAPSLSPEAVEALARHRWPGNVRELKNEVERALLLCDGAVLGPDHFALGGPSVWAEDETLAHLTPTERAERARIVATLADCVQNQTRAAEALGMTRKMLADRLVRYGIPRPMKR